MRGVILLVGLVASCGTLVGAKKITTPDLIVYVDGNRPAPSVDYTARTLVTWMFARIGVRLAWSDGTPNGSSPFPGRTVHVQFVPEGQFQGSPDALACTFPFSHDIVTITIVYSRLQHLAAISAREPKLLAHVIAHEITHVLQGTNAHAEKGIMKARWNGQDYDAMSRRPLEFTPVDVDLIRTNLRGTPAGRGIFTQLSEK